MKLNTHLVPIRGIRITYRYVLYQDLELFNSCKYLTFLWLNIRSKDKYKKFYIYLLYIRNFIFNLIFYNNIIQY